MAAFNLADAYAVLQALTRGLVEPRCGECLHFRETSLEKGTCRGAPPRTSAWGGMASWAVVEKKETGCVAFVSKGAATKLIDAVRDEGWLAKALGVPGDAIAALRARILND